MTDEFKRGFHYGALWSANYLGAIFCPLPAVYNATILELQNYEEIMRQIIKNYRNRLNSERAAAGRRRFAEDLAAGRIGKTVHTKSGKDRPSGRPRAEFDQAEARRLQEEEKLSFRQIAKRLGGVSAATVRRMLLNTTAAGVQKLAG